MATKYFEQEGMKSAEEATRAEVRNGFYAAGVEDPEDNMYHYKYSESAHEDIGFCGDRLTTGQKKI